MITGIYRLLIPQIFKHSGVDSFIAGGGIWPGPYLFDKNRRNQRFFGHAINLVRLISMIIIINHRVMVIIMKNGMCQQLTLLKVTFTDQDPILIAIH